MTKYDSMNHDWMCECVLKHHRGACVCLSVCVSCLCVQQCSVCVLRCVFVFSTLSGKAGVSLSCTRPPLFWHEFLHAPTFLNTHTILKAHICKCQSVERQSECLYSRCERVYVRETDRERESKRDRQVCAVTWCENVHLSSH